MSRRRASSPSQSQIRKAIRRSRWRQAISWVAPRWLSIANALALFVLAVALFTSDRFQVQAVSVRRQSASADEAVTRATQLSHVVGHNIFLLNTTRVAAEVATVPSVLTARVTPRLPNAVEIEIEERVPIATWEGNGGAFLVDDQGFLLAPASSVPGGKVEGGFTIKDTTGEARRLGDRVNQRMVLAARELYKHLPATGVHVRDVELSTQGLVLVTDPGWRVIFGEPDGINAKVANFSAVLDLASTQNIKIAVLDLRPKDRPFYQMAP